MVETMMDRNACNLVAVNSAIASGRLGFDMADLVRHIAKAVGVKATFWDHVDFVPGDIIDLAGDVRQAQKQHEHGRTLLFGADLENQVTAIALRFMAEGLETYLLKDLTSSFDSRFEAIHEMRLFSVGVIPTTMSQVLLEWAAVEPDPELKRHLTDVLALYRTIQVGAPR